MEDELGLRNLPGVICNIGFNIYHAWMEDLDGRLLWIFNQEPPDKFQTQRFLSSPIRFNTEGMLGLLDQICITLRGYFIGESAIPGVVNDLLKATEASAFNRLLMAGHLSRLDLNEVYQCTGRIEGWCKSHGMSGSIIQFEHLMVHMFFCHL